MKSKNVTAKTVTAPVTAPVTAKTTIKSKGTAIINGNTVKAMSNKLQAKPWPIDLKKACMAIQALSLGNGTIDHNCLGHKITSKSAAIDNCLIELSKGNIQLNEVINYLGQQLTVYGKRYDRLATLQKLLDHSRYYVKPPFNSRLIKGTAVDHSQVKQAFNNLGLLVYQYIK